MQAHGRYLIIMNDGEKHSKGDLISDVSSVSVLAKFLRRSLNQWSSDIKHELQPVMTKIPSFSYFYVQTSLSSSRKRDHVFLHQLLK